MEATQDEVQITFSLPASELGALDQLAHRQTAGNRELLLRMLLRLEIAREAERRLADALSPRSSRHVPSQPRSVGVRERQVLERIFGTDKVRAVLDHQGDGAGE